MPHRGRTSQDLVHLRSGKQCEAMVPTKRGVYTRCWKSPVETHHLITRARGGHILDQVFEEYHLIDLCHHHHRLSDGGDAYMAGLLIDGYVQLGSNGRPQYYGTDPYLSQKYPRPKERRAQR